MPLKVGALVFVIAILLIGLLPIQISFSNGYTPSKATILNSLQLIVKRSNLLNPPIFNLDNLLLDNNNCCMPTSLIPSGRYTI